MRDKRSARRFMYALVAAAVPFGMAHADTVIDLTTSGSSGTLDGAIFSAIDPQPTGTGYIDPFLRLQNKGTEAGYNTDGALEFDTKPSIHTHSIQLSNVPEVTVGGVTYREFLLDINESKPGTLLSLDQLKISLDSSGTLTGYPDNFSAPVYDLDASGDNWVKLNYDLNNGSGSGDMRVLIPTSVFGTDESQYVYLYSLFGENFPSDAGFEEWWVGQSDSNEPVPEPSTLALSFIGGGAFIGYLQRKKKRMAA
jgi:hypothetical protein